MIRKVVIGAAAVGGLALALYALTLAPTVTLVDSGELIVAAKSLGVAHPPGFPLYVLLAHLATYLPVGNLAARVNFASALFAALAAGAMVFLVAEALLAANLVAAPGRKPAGRKGRAKGGKDKSPAKQEEGAPGTHGPLTVFVPAALAGLLLAGSRTLWAYATIAEVYTLNTLLILVIFALMFRWRRRILETQKGSATGKSTGPDAAGHAHDRLLYTAAFVFGLAFGVHHVTLGLTLPALAVFVLLTAGWGFYRGKRLLYAALFACAGLAIYIYLPLAAARSPIMNWGDPDSVEKFWWHVSGRQYQVFFTFDLERMINQSGEFFTLLGREFGPRWLPLTPLLALAGFVALFRRDRTAFYFLLLVIGGNLLYALNYEIAEDKDAYYLPTFLALITAAGFGGQWVITLLSVRFPARRVEAAAAGLLLLPAIALASNWPYNNRSQFYIARDYVENTLTTVEPDGLLLTQDWQIYSPMLYFQQLENYRADVVSIDVSLLRRTWYYDLLERAYPRLIEGSRDRVTAFLETLRRWEQDPDLFNRDVTLNQRINTQFYDLIMSFVETHVASAPVYVTQDVATDFQGQNSELTRRLVEKYAFVPQGLVFQLTQGREFRQPADPQLNTRGLADGTLKFEPEDVVRQKVFPVYVSMLINRGRYLAAYKKYEPALEAVQRALALDPNSPQAKQLLAEYQVALRAPRLPGSQ